MTTQTEIAPISIRQPGGAHVLRRCYGYLRPYRRLVAGIYTLMFAVTGLSLAIPQFIRWIVDRGMRGHDTELLAWSVVALLALTLIKGVFTFLQGRWTEVASQGVAYDLRSAIHHRLADLSFAYHDRTETGQLLSRAVQDVERIRFLTGRASLRIIEGAALLAGTCAAMLLMSPKLALLSLAAMPLLAYRALAFGRRYRPITLAIQNQLAVLTTRLEQNLRGARIVKAFAQEEAEISRFDRENGAWFDLAARSARLQALNVPVLGLIANVASVVVIWHGGLLVIRGEMTLGELVAFTTYVAQLVQPVRRLGMIIPSVAMASTAGQRIFEILDAKSEVAEKPDATVLRRVRGHVRFEQVSFAYSRRHSVLEDITFETAPGEVVALMGATGSGKSTITHLIPRFYDPTRGRVTIDGVDIREVTLSSLRDQIGVVLQDTTLFAASIRENLAFGRPDATLTEIVAAAEAAQAHEFIAAMPGGYDAPVGERGATLSGGQRQRVAIARALLKDPRILILDDATSSVDTETEELIQLALNRLMRGRTCFVIAQRLSTVRQADAILVLEKGRIAAMGTHEQLLASSSLYSAIYEGQLRPQERRP